MNKIRTQQKQRSTKPMQKTIEEETAALEELLREYMIRSYTLERRRKIVAGIAYKKRTSL